MAKGILFILFIFIIGIPLMLKFGYINYYTQSAGHVVSGTPVQYTTCNGWEWIFSDHRPTDGNAQIVCFGQISSETITW